MSDIGSEEFEEDEGINLGVRILIAWCQNIHFHNFALKFTHLTWKTGQFCKHNKLYWSIK